MEDWSRAMTLEGIRSIIKVRFEWRTEDKFSLILFWRVFFWVASSMDGLAFWDFLWISETDIFVGSATKRMLGCNPARFFTQLSCAVSLWMWKTSPWNHRNHPTIFTKNTWCGIFSIFVFCSRLSASARGPSPGLAEILWPLRTSLSPQPAAA